MNFELTGKVAVITGGTGALGEAITRGLANAGAAVAVLARDEEKIQTLVESIQAGGADALGVSADVLDKAAMENAAAEIRNAFGRVDLLINGAGGNKAAATTMPGDPNRTFFDLPQDALEWVFNLNFTGSVLASQVFAKPMVEQGSGAILNISSMASQRAISRVVAYSGAKAAIDNFTRWLAVHMATEYSPNIRVNAIAPGFFLGEQNRFLLIDEQSGDLTPRGRSIIDHTPMRRFGDPDDLLGATIWLLSDAARFVTGVVVPVDGGFSVYSGI